MTVEIIQVPFNVSVELLQAMHVVSVAFYPSMIHSLSLAQF